MYLSNKKRFIIFGELRKMFHLIFNSIDCKSLHQVEWDL